ncbi:hypothetical protein Cantr_01382 [Candida viswanathii]|uniref:Uncharacterized protein n=1 Tax=Candida viswanathii TaxID=5486 RepID=A0A367YHX2_9ASCO|nr:hypothetical protein Cantr_01382 [Candida viswanathii]
MSANYNLPDQDPLLYNPHEPNPPQINPGLPHDSAPPSQSQPDHPPSIDRSTSPRITLTRPSDVNINHDSENLVVPHALRQQQNDDPHDVSEETPLLAHNIDKHALTRGKQKSRLYTLLSIFGTLILAFVLLGYVIYNIVVDLQPAVDKSVHLNINEVSMKEMTPSGIDVHIAGTIEVNYDKIDNTIQRVAVKVFTGIFGSLTITNLQPVEIHTKFIDLDSPFIHLVDSLPPPIEVEILNSANTAIDFVSPCQFVGSGFVEFLKYYYQLGDEIKLEVKGTSKEVQVHSWFLKGTVRDVEFHDFITVNKDEIVPDVNIDTFDLSSNGGQEINIKADATIITKFLPMSISLPFGIMNWNLFFEDCDGSLIKVGEWQSSRFEVVPHKPISLTVIGNITSMPDSLMDDCSDDGQSPVNRILEKYLHEEPIEFYLQMKDQGNIPEWIFKFLHDSPVKLAVKLPKINAGSLPLDLTIDSSELELKDNLTTRWNSSLSIITKRSKVDFDVSKFKFDFVLSGKHGSQVLTGSSDNQFVHLNMTHNGHLNIAAMLPNMDLSVPDPAELGVLINELLNEHMVQSDLFVHGNLQEVDVELPFWNGSKMIKHIAIPSTKILPKVGDLDYTQDFLNNLTIDNIFLVDSTPTNLKLLVDLTLLNPTNFTIDLSDEITFGVSKNDSLINLITVKNCVIPRQDFFNVTLEMDIRALNYYDHANLEYSLVRFYPAGT